MSTPRDGVSSSAPSEPSRSAVSSPPSIQVGQRVEANRSDPLLASALMGVPEATAAPRTGPVDPVRGLLHRHRRLCESAVDPLEIAVGLETHGLTDRTAARFRHRDVFSLAEELYARAPRVEGAECAGEHRPVVRRRVRARVVGRWSLWLLPGTLCASTLVALALLDTASGQARLIAGVLGACLVAAAVGYCLRGTGLSSLATLSGCWLVAYALYGDDLLRAAVAGGPEQAPVPVEWCVPLSLAFGLAGGLGCARWFAIRARSRLLASRSLAEFTATVRPLLAWSVGLFVTSLAVLWLVTHQLLAAHNSGTGAGSMGAGGVQAAVVEARPVTMAALLALGLLFFLALLVTSHGFPRVAAAALAGAAVVEILVLAGVFIGRLPWLGWLARPAELLVAGAGQAVVPAVACGGAAVVLLCRSTRLLAGASAHGRPWAADSGPT